MTYSLIKPKQKSLFSFVAKIWLIFYILCIGVILSFYFFVLAKTTLMNMEIETKKQELIKMQEQTSKNNADFDTLTARKNFALSVLTSDGDNMKIRNIVNNLFDFVIKSGAIRLESVKMDKFSLELVGITPTKEMFALLIQTPLKSTFDTSSINFYPLSNGWYKFVSVNKNIEGLK
ncbi:hypothetical protein [uncultured Campylobacter sp.]|uniref:hypothetical protein n=1 Tax=uncultured Campylobacter sp. TaxID=218934 RepID=UPI00262656FC|nr:hypothetical protein [uncultured Campylobacter sp.]